MNLFSLFQLSNKNYFSFILALFPLSFLAGNMLININIILIIISAIILFNFNFFKIKYFLLDKLIFLFFFTIFISAIFNDFYLYYNYYEFSTFRGIYGTTIKSLSFLRYFLLYIVIRFLIEKNYINFRYLFIVSSFCALFVCFDIFFQSIVGKDFFGYETNPKFRKLAGPFGDEYIAGGYIQRFSLFSFFIFSSFYLKIKKKFSYILFPILFLIFFIGIMLSGNRMPLILFLLATSLMFILETKTKRNLIFFLIFIFFSFFIVLNLNSTVKDNFRNFKGNIQKLVLNFSDQNSDYKHLPYRDEFSSAFITWKYNKIIGGGIKNFNYYCYKSLEKFDKKYKCNLHPHNYYLEILTETGIIGFFIIIVILFNILYLILKKYFPLSKLQNNRIILPFVLLFLTEFFPIKSSGSFFTTGNASLIFLMLALLIGILLKDYSIENKN